MFSRRMLIFFAFSISVVCSSRKLGPSPDNQLMKIYVVNVDLEMYHDDCEQYKQVLQKVVHGRSPKDALVYCYKELQSGFAAELTDEEAEKLRGEKGIFDVAKEEIYSVEVEPNSYRFPKHINN